MAHGLPSTAATTKCKTIRPDTTTMWTRWTQALTHSGSHAVADTVCTTVGGQVRASGLEPGQPHAHGAPDVGVRERFPVPKRRPLVPQFGQSTRAAWQRVAR